MLEPLSALERRGWEITLVGVDGNGWVDLDELDAALRDDTVLVSLMLANNETGTIQPVADAARLAHARGALVHCDAAQAIGKIPVDVAELDVDLLTASAHKFYGPKGVGALWIRHRRPPIRLATVFFGGGQEGGLRSGTPNVPGAVGMARAMEIAVGEGDEEGARLALLRDRLEDAILEHGEWFVAQRRKIQSAAQYQQSLHRRHRDQRPLGVAARPGPEHGVGLHLRPSRAVAGAPCNGCPR